LTDEKVESREAMEVPQLERQEARRGGEKRGVRGEGGEGEGEGEGKGKEKR
jgi:hypothetical protein